MKESILKTKSYRFALNTIDICKKLMEQKEYILSKQLLRASTSIGANIREANYAQSTKDFIHKLNISLKECDETQYWLELLFDSHYLESKTYKELHEQSNEIKKMLISSILTSKKKLNVDK
jgi:four helix bundle protein